MKRKKPNLLVILLCVFSILYFALFVVLSLLTVKNGGNIDETFHTFRTMFIIAFAFMTIFSVAWMALSIHLANKRRDERNSQERHRFTGSEKSEFMACPKCKTVNPSENQFCSSCGAELHPGEKDLPLFESNMEKSGLPFSVRMKAFWYMKKWFFIVIPLFLFYGIGAIVYNLMQQDSQPVLAASLVLGVCFFALILIPLVSFEVSPFGRGHYFKSRFFADGIEVVVYNRKTDAEVTRIFYSYSSFVRGKLKDDWYYLTFAESSRSQKCLIFRKTNSYQVNMALDNMIKKGKM